MLVLRDNAIGNYNGTNYINTLSESLSETLIETQKKYITTLEKEIEELKRLLERK